MILRPLFLFLFFSDIVRRVHQPQLLGHLHPLPSAGAAGRQRV